MSGFGGEAVERGRELSVLEGEHSLDEAGDARGGVEVAEVGLDRAEGAERGLSVDGAEGLGERGDLDGIAEGGAGAVGLDEADGVRGDGRRGRARRR